MEGGGGGGKALREKGDPKVQAQALLCRTVGVIPVPAADRNYGCLVLSICLP